MYDYIASDLLVRVHDTVRYLLNGSKTSNVFNVDVDTQAGKDYRKCLSSVLRKARTRSESLFSFAVIGASSKSVAIWAFAGVFGFAILFSFIASCFCKRRCRRKAYGGKTGIRKWIGPRCVYLLMLLGMCISAAVAMGHGSKYVTGIEDGIKGIQTIGKSFVDSNDATKDVVKVEFANIDTDLTAALAVVVDPGLETTLQDLKDANDGYVANVDTLADSLEEMSKIWNRDFVNADLDQYKPKINWEHAKNGFAAGLYAVGVVSIIWVILHSFGLLANKCSAFYFRVTAIFTLLVAILIMTLCGLTLMIAFIGSDFCVDPPNSIDNVLSVIDTQPLIRDSVSYYARCPGTGTYSGILEDIDDLVSGVNSYVDLINDAISEATTAGETAVVTELDKVLTSATEIQDSAAEIFDNMDCPVVGVALDKSLTGMCNGMVVGDIYVTMALGAAGVFFIPLLFAAVSLCCRHPGDPSSAPPSGVGETVSKMPPHGQPAQAWQPVTTTPIATGPIRHGGPSMV